MAIPGYLAHLAECARLTGTATVDIRLSTVENSICAKVGIIRLGVVRLRVVRLRVVGLGVVRLGVVRLTVVGVWIFLLWLVAACCENQDEKQRPYTYIH